MNDTTLSIFLGSKNSIKYLYDDTRSMSPIKETLKFNIILIQRILPTIGLGVYLKIQIQPKLIRSPLFRIIKILSIIANYISYEISKRI